MSFNLCQQAFVLSMLSNNLVNIAGDTPDTKANLEKRLYDAITKHLGDHKAEMDSWEIVWGPAVFVSSDYQKQPPGTGIADNVVYVARKAGHPATYVVAVAGTNRYSAYGKQVEDGAVDTTWTWTEAFTKDLQGKDLLKPYRNPLKIGHPCLSAGTVAGVQILLSTVPEAATNPNDRSPSRLFEFLAHLPPSKATLIITGHSLGGALAPALALALMNPEGGPLAATNWGPVHVLPSAGATPGNADFVKAFEHVFPGIPTAPETDPSRIELWNRNIANKRDIVPLAWIPGEMDSIPPRRDGSGGIYPHLQWADDSLKNKLRFGVSGAEMKSRKGARSTPAGGRLEAGEYAKLPSIPIDTSEIDPNDAIATLIKETDGGVSFIDHWLKQHSTAYIEQIFKVGGVFPSSGAKLFASGVGASLLDVPDDAAD